MKVRKADADISLSMREKAYQHVQRKVLSGELPAGSLLSEVSLARQLGFSRTPLREAIGQLVAEGFLRQIPNRGTSVLEFSLRDVAELYELREALEVYAIGKASERSLRPVDLDMLVRLVKDIPVLMTELEASGYPRLNTDQMQRFVKMDLDYHTVLVAAAGNNRIMKTVSDTRVLLNVFSMRRKGHSISQLAEIHRFHREILQAVVQKDSETATRLLSEHIRLSKSERLQEYEEWEHEKAMRRVIVELGNENQLAFESRE